MIRHMAIDPGQKLGWCHGVPGEKPISGVFKLTGDRLTRKLINLENWIVSMIRGNNIGRVYVESPLNLQKNSFDAIASIMGVYTTIGKECTRAGVDMFGVDIQNWRSEVMRDPGMKTGIIKAPKMTDDEMIALLVDVKDPDKLRTFMIKGLTDEKKAEARRRWMKRRTIEECVKRGYTPETDDESDAIGIWSMIADREMKQAASPKFDLLGGLTI